MMQIWKNRVVFSLFLIMCVAHLKPISAQNIMTIPAKPATIRYVILDDYIRDFLAQEWDKHSGDSAILERGYCLKYQLDIWAGEIVYRVTQISTPLAIDARPQYMSMSCPLAINGAIVHIHTPQTCISDTVCFNGGPSSYQCIPSDTDTLSLFFSRQPFAMIQCSREAVVPYMYPDVKNVTEVLSR